MAIDPVENLPPHGLAAASFAESLAKDYERSGGRVQDLFAAFVGLVCVRDKSVGTDCLIALDHKLSGG